MNSNSYPRFVILAILDGWGIATEGPGNAISLSRTINMDKLWLSYPHTELKASGESVGLPKGEDGNTETGHLNLGAGRIVYQDLQRIDMAVADGSFFENKILREAIEHARDNNSNLHLMGLIGGGGVHSNIYHLYAIIHLASRLNFSKVFIHCFTDGRDSPPTSAKTYIKNLKKVLEKEKVGTIASIMGRYWAMDRDQRWDRTQKAYLALTKGIGIKVRTPEEAVDNSYLEGKTDEFIEPSLVTSKDGKPIALIKDNDSVIFFNFRIDRPRQLTKAFVFEDFSKASLLFDINRYGTNLNNLTPRGNALVKEPFERGPKLKNLYFVTMTDYGKPINEAGAKVAFPPEVVEMPLSGIISVNGLRQLKITESEKERFVTFYFNGLREKPYNLEERVIIPSIKVPFYDQKPEMQADEITRVLLDKLSQGGYKFVVVNYPNADMVGHTGNIGAAVKAIEKVDECVGKLSNFSLAYEGALVITADHGNAEEMINLKTGEIDTEHSTNPVPLIVVSHKFTGKGVGLRSGILADVAPTILSLLNLPVPSSMSGRNLLTDLNLF